MQNNDRTIKLTVKSGIQKPYLCKSKAYKRTDTATIEVDTLELSRLILEGKNIRFEELPCEDQELTFDTLCRKLKECIQIETFNQDILKMLNLYNSTNGSNNAAGILADRNHFPGGLPSGITEDEYLSGKLSVLRNRNPANVFYRLGFVEIFGTGVTRIKQLYEEGLKQPDFEVSENTIKIVLPVFEKNFNLTEDKRRIYKILSKTMLKAISEIAPYAPFGKSKTTQLLKEMSKKGVVKIEGRGKGTRYVIK